MFESIGELGGFPDSHQELRLRDEFLRLHPVLFCGCGQGCEINVDRDVLFSGGFVGVSAYRMLADGF